MSEKPMYPEWQFKPVRLTIKEIDDPLEIIRHFVIDRHLPVHRLLLSNLLEAALASSQINFIDGTEAAEIVNYCRDLEVFIEAVFVLTNNLSSAE